MIGCAFIREQAEPAARWLHGITATGWTSASFYFIARDPGLRHASDYDAGIHGKEWQVHGGGFYHIRKYLVAPSRLPEDVTWFKWESYATWLTGFVMMVLLCYPGAELFLKLRDHYLQVFASAYSWAIASLAFLMAVTILHFFNSQHACKGAPRSTSGLTAALFVAIAARSMAPLISADPEDADSAELTGPGLRLARAEGFKEVQDIVLERCSMCPTKEPCRDGIAASSKGVRLQAAQQIAARGRNIFLQAGATSAMPPANVTDMEPEKRAAIVPGAKPRVRVEPGRASLRPAQAEKDCRACGG